MKNASYRTASAVIALGLVASPAALAEEKAHEHGHGTLNVVALDGALKIELIAPGADIVGFEHEPKSSADKAAVKKAVALLEDGGSIIVTPAAAGCKLTEAEIESALIEDDHGHDHSHGHGHDKEDEEVHSEFHVEYSFACSSMQDLTHLDLDYFKTFSGAEELDVQAITASGQIAAELNPKEARLALN